MNSSKEVNQELGLTTIGNYNGEELNYMTQGELRVFFYHGPERIVSKDFKEETVEEYKNRRKLLKFMSRKRNRMFWNSSVLGSYKVSTVEEVEAKYAEMKENDAFEEKLLEMDEKMREDLETKN